MTVYSIQYTSVLPGACGLLPEAPRCTQFSTPGCFRVHDVCFRVHDVCFRVHRGCFRVHAACFPVYESSIRMVYGEFTEAQGVSTSVHTVLRALQGLTPRLSVALSTGQTALRGQSAFHRPVVHVVCTQRASCRHSAGCIRVARIVRTWRALRARGEGLHTWRRISTRLRSPSISYVPHLLRVDDPARKLPFRGVSRLAIYRGRPMLGSLQPAEDLTLASNLCVQEVVRRRRSLLSRILG